MNWSKMTKDEVLLKGGIMINNSLNDESILTSVSLYGYTAEKITVGKQLLSNADAVKSVQVKEQGEMQQAQSNYDNEKAAANKEYMKHLSVARIVFKTNVQAIKTLELGGKRAVRIAEWIQQGRNFYKAILANAEWLAMMAEFGQTSEILNAALEKLETVSTLLETLKKETGEAQNATVVRDEKFAELIEWLSDYEEIASIALEDQPQLLEKLGVVVKV